MNYKLEYLIDSLSFFQLALQIIFVGALRTACIFSPFLAFQAYGYYNMCVGRSHDEIRPWCKARIPLLYSYIQSHYWYVHHKVPKFMLIYFANHMLLTDYYTLFYGSMQPIMMYFLCSV